MANDLFGGLGGLMKGLASMAGTDTAEGRLLAAQAELTGLDAEEKGIYEQIGREAVQNGYQCPGFQTQLAAVAAKRAAAQAKRDAAQAEADAAKRASERAEAARHCPNCEAVNEPGAKFCAGCGSPLPSSAGVFCPNCGQELKAGARFCGNCGTAL